MKYRSAQANNKAHIRSLWYFILLLLGVIAYLIHSWSEAPDMLRVYQPPDLSTMSVTRAGEINKPAVYSFAYYIMQQLNHWKTDGAIDYPQNIHSLSAYLTPRYQETLRDDVERRKHKQQLIQRQRTVAEVAGHTYESRRVQELGANTWIVWLDLEITETVHGMQVKDVQYRYPMRVVFYDVDPEINPWGLALDGLAEDATRITEQDN